MKKTFFYIDDTIWVFRDLTRQKPRSMFDNAFLKMLKTAHENYGLKVQLNCFYRTDFFYGDDEFSLSEMTDAYKKEWEDNSDWLKLAFHSKQEFPDYPYINATYETVKNNFMQIHDEIQRFAGENSFSYAAVTHWSPMSKQGCIALRDCGVKIMSVTDGERREYNGDPSSLPYGHAARLLHNRQSEAGVFTRVSLDSAITNSLCAYNHLPSEKLIPTEFELKAVLDEETGLYFKKFTNGPTLDLSSIDGLEAELKPIIGKEYICASTHEQYFYPEYFNYQKNYSEKLFLCARILRDNGYEYIFPNEITEH